MGKRMSALALFLAFSLVAASLAGCGSSNATASSAVSATSSQPSSAAASKTSDYPNKPITSIVAWSAGGATDVSMRMLACVLPIYLNGQSIVVENQAGGAAVPGTNAIAQAKNDGYTIGMNWDASFILRPHIMEVPYTLDDFTYICGIYTQRNCIYVNADSPFKTVEDLVEYAKAHPGELNYSPGAIASYQHLIAEAFLKAADIKAEVVPYDSARPAAVAMMGGNLDFCVLEVPTCYEEYKAGTIRALCTFEADRPAALPDIPTALESGYDVSFPNCQNIIGPAGMPKEAVEKLALAVKECLSDPEYIKMAENAGMELNYKTGEELYQDILKVSAEIEAIAKEIM
jgi:tripartite-type tricarboxylate transporter receptor subunit TctC